mmetsp:Transcript_38687/g.116205  ORF Transcript_38687/g.116205 Transcript_38687/m.116205 type:complete len:570 (-) Transcript_38687:451-2160(-)
MSGEDFNYDDSDDVPVGDVELRGPESENVGGGGSSAPDPHLPNPDNPKLEQTHEGEFREDHGESGPLPVTKATYLFAFCAALNSCNLGYDIGVNTDAGPKLQSSMGLTDVELEIFMGSLNLFAMVGSLLSHFFSDRYGRRVSFVVAAVSFIIGVIIQATAASYGLLMFGRVFVGLGVGFGLAIDPIYIAEISPAAHRGMLVTWSEIAINIGIVLGFISGAVFYNTPEEEAWRYMFGLGAVMPAIMIVLVKTVMPESPRWLVSKNRTAEAREVLEKTYPPRYNVDAVVYEINESVQREYAAEHATGWDMILFPTPAFRRMLLVGIGTAVAQQVTGIDAIQYFLVFIIEESGIKSRGAQTAVLIFLGVLKLSCIFLAGRLFDKRGRRPLFFLSLTGMTVALLFLSINFFAGHNSAFAVCSLAIYLSFFSFGMGPGAWLIPSEVFSLTIRTKAMSIATFLNRVAATLMASTFLSTAHAISWAGFFLLLAIVCMMVAAFVYFFVPETKGRSLEDMSMYFAELTGDRSIMDAEAKLRAEENVSVQMSSQQQNQPRESNFTDVVNEDANVVGTMT